MSLEAALLSFVFVFLASFFLPQSSRRWPFMVVSLLFLYALNRHFALGFLAIAVLNYSLRNKEKLFSVLVFINIAFLVFFKYLLPANIWFSWNILVPLGLSVFIFQQLAFLIDGKRNPANRETSFSDFFLYSFFFTTLTTGPVARISSLVKERKTHFVFTSANLIQGASLICLGLFQKLVIADNIAILTSPMLKPETSYESYDITMAFLLNKYEIFANFSGFTDVALGMALVFGIQLPINFNRPFRIPSMTEFWKRWHISLSLWIRDYVFLPLSLSPLGRWGVIPILFVTFTLFAIWHDLKFTFILYGWIQVLLILSSRFFSFRGRAPVRVFQWLFFYVVLLSIPAILFRVSDTSQFVAILQKLLTSSPVAFLSTALHYKTVLVRILCGIVLYECFIHFGGISWFCHWFRKRPYVARTALVSLFFLLLLVLSGLPSGSQFIYSRF